MIHYTFSTSDTLPLAVFSVIIDIVVKAGFGKGRR